MDVAHLPSSGTLPNRPLLAQRAGLVRGAGVAGTAAAPPPMVQGTPDGADIVLPSGVRIRRTRIGAQRVGEQQLLQAIRGVQLLPPQHQAALARTGIPIELVPAQSLEVAAGMSGPVLGLTTIENREGTWQPTRLRVAVDSPRSGPSNAGVNGVEEVVQHEIGHVIAVLGSQDRTEQTAMLYAATY